MQERLSGMSDVKKNIQEKVKSLKRRRGADPAGLKAALNNLQVGLQDIVDVYKKLGQFASEGRALYTAVRELPDAKVDPEVWKRVLKAWSYEAWCYEVYLRRLYNKTGVGVCQSDLMI